jgi:hypothetical protein
MPAIEDSYFDVGRDFLKMENLISAFPVRIPGLPF